MTGLVSTAEVGVTATVTRIHGAVLVTTTGARATEMVSRRRGVGWRDGLRHVHVPLATGRTRSSSVTARQSIWAPCCRSGAKRAAVVTQDGVPLDVEANIPHEVFRIGVG